ncbi:MAG: bifunctional riboflavin kinase/FAD synthetase [Terriglobia bacterium]
MKVVHDLSQLPPLPRGAALTIGNFDGVHLAHQQLLRRVVERARGAVAAALTFEPHPIRVLAPDRAPQLLSPPGERARLIEQQGIELLVVLHFTEDLARVAPESFVRDILVKRLRAVLVCVGPNFRFGYRQAGDTAKLTELSRKEGFAVEILPAVTVRKQMVSSTRIRQLLAEGRVHMAGRLLGRPFRNSGAIVAGESVGRRLTVPTLNLAPVEEQLPRAGVYVTRTHLGEKTFLSVTNVGTKPTFGEHRVTVETHLLNFDSPIHQGAIMVEYLHRLRDEIKFENVEALKIQIQKDARRSLKFFRLLENIGIETPRRAS